MEQERQSEKEKEFITQTVLSLGGQLKFNVLPYGVRAEREIETIMYKDIQLLEGYYTNSRSWNMYKF